MEGFENVPEKPDRPSRLEKVWEHELGAQNTWGLAVGDVDGDGNLECCVNEYGGNVIILDAVTGTEKARNTGGTLYQAGISLADVNNDGVLEIITGGFSNKIRAIKGDGTLEWSFPTNGAIESTAVIADIDGDGSPNVVMGTRADEIHALDSDGTELWTHSVTNGQAKAIAAADLTGNGQENVVFISDAGELTVIDDYSTDATGATKLWTTTAGGGAGRSIIVDDITGDGNDEIIFISDKTGYAYDSSGNQLWSHGVGAGQGSYVETAELFDDGTKFVLWGDGAGRIHAREGATGYLNILTKGINTFDMEGGIRAADFNGDGILEIGVVMNGSIQIFNRQGNTIGLIPFQESARSDVGVGDALGLGRPQIFGATQDTTNGTAKVFCGKMV